MDSQFGDERLARLYRYWWQKRGSRVAPNRADLNPAEIPDLLPILNLIDVAWRPLAFRHRLVGTELVERLGRDATGKAVAGDLYGPAAPEIFETLGRLVAEVRPYRRRARLVWHRRNWLTMEAVELPLVDDTDGVVMILRGAAVSTIQPGFPERLEYVALGPPEAA